MPEGLKRHISCTESNGVRSSTSSGSTKWMACYGLKTALYCTHTGAQRSSCRLSLQWVRPACRGLWNLTYSYWIWVGK